MRTERIPAGPRRLLVATLLAFVGSGALAGAATASNEVIYNNIPGPHVGLPALGFASDAVAEFGGEVQFAGTNRTSPVIGVELASYACQEGGDNEGCKSAHGSAFEWPITLNIYEVGSGDAVGPLITTETSTFKIPYRPSESSKCPEVGGYSKGFGKQCQLSLMHQIRFTLPRVTLPSKAILAVAYNTASYGKHPTGNGEGPYNALNVAVNASETCVKENANKECEKYAETKPSAGSDPFPAQAFANSNSSEVMCGGPLGEFAATGECWESAQPAFEVRARKP
jgi:hypothetical protein